MSDGVMVMDQTTVLGYAYMVTLFNSYEEAAVAREVAFEEDPCISHGGCNYYGGGRYIVWLAKGSEEYYL